MTAYSEFDNVIITSDITSPRLIISASVTSNNNILLLVDSTSGSTTTYPAMAIATHDAGGLVLGYNSYPSTYQLSLSPWTSGEANIIATNATNGFRIAGNSTKLILSTDLDLPIQLKPYTAGSTGKVEISGSLHITGSLNVIPGNLIELQVTNTGVTIGNSLTDIHNITGSVRLNGGITSSLFGTSSWAINADNTSTINISSFSSNVDSYLLMSNVLATTNVGIGGDTDLKYNAFTNTLTINNISATSVTGSVFGTSSWSTQAISASYVPDYVLNSATSSMLASYVLNSQTSSFVRNSQTSSMTVLSASFSLTASYVNTLNQNVIISGSTLSIIPSTLAGTLTEQVLIIGPASSSLEGGQIMLQAPGGTYTSASMWDNYTNRTRLLRGTNNGSDAEVVSWNMHTKQMVLHAYNSLNAFPATSPPVVAALGVDSGGNVITIQTGSGAGGGGGSTFSPGTNVDNRIITSTGTTPELNGEANLTFNGSSLTVTGQITSSGAIISTANNQMYFRGGDDAEFWDINVPNTVGIYGQQTASVAGVKLGSGGPTLYGSGSRLGIGTTAPVATLDVNGKLYVASGITGSLQGTSSWATNALSSSFLTPGTYNITSSWAITAVTSSFATLLGFGSGIDSPVILTNATSTTHKPLGTVNGFTFNTTTGILNVTSSRALTASYALSSPGGSAISFYSSSNLLTSNLSSLVVTGTGVTATNNSGVVTMSFSTGGGSGTTLPGGSSGYVQYNSASAFGGEAQFTYDYQAGSTSLLTVPGIEINNCLRFLSRTTVDSGNTPYTAQRTELVYLCDTVSSAVDVDLTGNVAQDGQIVIIKDIGYNSSVNNITFGGASVDNGNITVLADDGGCLILTYIQSLNYWVAIAKYRP